MERTNHYAASDYDAEQHLGVILALCDAVRGGYDALAADRLDEFRRHTTQLEELGAQLTATLSDIAKPPAGGSNTSRPAFLLADNVRLAHLRLAHLTQRLAALLRHRRRSVDLLETNCSFFLAASGADTASAAAQPTWSFEA